MGEIKHFSDLDAWKINHQAALLIYKITKDFPQAERFGMIDQLRRAATSVTANIAEGWGRYHYQDRIRFYYQARGSNSEVENFLLLAKDLAYSTEKDFQVIYALVKQGNQIISGLIRSIEKRK